MAEVLITLGIIGVVAALTMPALIAKYQQKALITQFKKIYSTLQNTVNLVNLENGVPYECYYLNGGGFYYSQCNEFYGELFKKLHFIKHCSPRDKNCRVQYKTRNEVIAEGGSASNKACSYHIEGSEAYYLNNGSVLYILSTVESEFNNQNATFLGVDINGLKGPNRWGYDMFYLNFLRKNMTKNVLFSTGICELIEKGGYSAEEMMLK